jgi:hypothetical protein
VGGKKELYVPNLPHMKKSLLLITLFCANLASAQISFQKNYGAANMNEYGQSVIQAADSGYYVAGGRVYTNPIIGEGLLMRIDKHGNEVWAKSYVTNSSIDIQLDDIIHTSDGNLIMVGVANYTLPRNYDVCLTKVDTAGNQLWFQTYGGDYRQRGMQVKETFDHGFIIGGWNEMFGTAISNFYLVRTDSNGDTLWTKNYPNGDQQYGYTVDQMPDSGFVIAGSIDVATWGASTYVIRTDKYGDTLWTKILSSIDYSTAYDVKANADGHVIISGYSNSLTMCSKPLLAELDENGDLLWHEEYADGPCGWSYSVAKTNDGGYAVFGMDNSSDFYLVKTDATGAEDWHQKYDEMPGEFGYSVKQTSDDGFIMAGIGNDNGNINIVLIKIGPDGTLSSRITSKQDNQFTIYPNPANTTLHIQHKEKVLATELYDVTGKLISSYGDVDKIDVSNLSKGMYFLQLQTAQQIVTKKFTVE